MRKKVLLATTNQGKLKEMKALMADESFELVELTNFPKTEEAPETGSSFLENALQKAKFYADKFKIPTIAEDSGLMIEALGDGPGVYSKRYGINDLQRINKILEKMEIVPDRERAAKYVCVAVYYDPKVKKPIISQGIVKGKITHKRQGRGGFGYDPIFYLPMFSKTAAEITVEQKNGISHRGMAIRKLREKIIDSYSKLAANGSVDSKS